MKTRKPDSTAHTKKNKSAFFLDKQRKTGNTDRSFKIIWKRPAENRTGMSGRNPRAPLP